MTSHASSVPEVCIAGIGGFGKTHHESAIHLENENRLRLKATCDPRAGQLKDLTESLRFRERGVEVFSDFEEMLDGHAREGDLVTLATPIALHAPMHASCVRRKLACYLEKPPTLDPEELERMISLDAGASFQTQVGFAYIVQPGRLELKRRIVAGEFGPIRAISYEGLWPRTDRYYARSPWAGKLRMGESLLLDSCFGNAMAHHAHNLLFFAGTDAVMSWADVKSVRAELYRANAIESPDTIFSEAVTGQGIRLRVAMSHAGPEAGMSRELIVAEKAEIEIAPGQYIEIRHSSGEVEKTDCSFACSSVTDNLRYYLDYLAGIHPRPLTRLSDSRPFVAWNALLYVAAGKITRIPTACISESEGEAGRALVIEGVEKATREFCERGTFPSAAGFDWASPGGEALAGDMSGLLDVVKLLAKTAAE